MNRGPLFCLKRRDQPTWSRRFKFTPRELAGGGRSSGDEGSVPGAKPGARCGCESNESGCHPTGSGWVAPGFGTWHPDSRTLILALNFARRWRSHPCPITLLFEFSFPGGEGAMGLRTTGRYPSTTTASADPKRDADCAGPPVVGFALRSRRATKPTKLVAWKTKPKFDLAAREAGDDSRWIRVKRHG